jgi:hypothetical protein
MKNTYLSIIAIFASLFTYSCKGPEGAVGPKGATGVTGATGATGSTGAAGANGNANVVYNDWKLSYQMGGGRYTNNVGRFVIADFVMSPTNTDEPILTKEAFTTGSVYTYAKFNALVYDAVNKTYDLPERIKLVENNATVDSYSLIPGRNKDQLSSYTFTRLANIDVRENYFSFFGFNSLKDERTKFLIPEFQGIDDYTFFQKAFMLDKSLLIRHVVVYGTTKGRLASINMNDYEEVKRALDLKD